MWVATGVFGLLTLLIVYLSFKIIRIGDEQMEIVEKYKLAYQPKYDSVYNAQEIRDLLGNSCKIPYIFLANTDIGDFHAYDFKSKCVKQNDENVLTFYMDGNLQLLDSAALFLQTNDFDCYFQKMGDVTTMQKMEMYTNYTIPFYMFEVVCLNFEKVIYQKPFINLAAIVEKNKEPSPSSLPVTILYVPRLNHKLFSRTFTDSKAFMQHHFIFFKMVFNGTNSADTHSVLKNKATKNGFKTFMPSDTTDFFDYLQGHYVDNTTASVESCLTDGTKLAEKQLEIFYRFNVLSRNDSYVSKVYLSPYGPRRNIIDEQLKYIIEQLFVEGIEKRTSIIVTSYNENEAEENEDELNPFFAIRLSDEYNEKYPERRSMLKKNSDRLMTTGYMDKIIENLIDHTVESPLTSLYSTTSNCDIMNNKNCYCMDETNTTIYEDDGQEQFMEGVWEFVEREINKIECFVKIDRRKVAYYRYSNIIKGELNVAELTADVTTNTSKVIEVRKTIKFFPFFKGFHGYDSVRAYLPDGNTLGGINPNMC